MNVVKITEIRDEITRAICEAEKAQAPTLVLVEARPAAYIVGAQQYEALLAERKRLRRELLLRDVDEAEAEIARGEARSFDNVEDLIAWLHREDSACD
jgi:PHD/YefM family antitoxin component YafN of YafNO toxin-antitoxin module